ncbi:MAG: hypothetical protein M3Z13_04290, partial [Candidatus Dormibacteraeota bacterium]|nr:hypothetical protein [Candidatus Dormibacteraeota bacterium]
MAGPNLVLAGAALAGAGFCLLLLASPDLRDAARRLRPTAVRLLAAEGTATALAQAELAWLPAPAGLAGRLGLA